MLIPHWDKPIYKFHNGSGENIIIDVTTSVSPGLPANHVFVEKVIPFLKANNVYKVLDFGAGSLRHTISLLNAGFEVGAVDFMAGFNRTICKDALARIRSNERFCLLEWPRKYIGNSHIFKSKFDAALLIYVLQTIPKPSERKDVLHYIFRKLKRNKYLFYCSRINQLDENTKKYPISDGYYMYPKREHHSFYREFTTGDTHLFMDKCNFRRIKSFSERGTDQMFLYIKGGFVI
jgi:2-polyprenyl-3-methyl-5-hydroxy-6-metoxy-1,4-benzoquinol methylase